MGGDYFLILRALKRACITLLYFSFYKEKNYYEFPRFPMISYVQRPHVIYDLEISLGAQENDKKEERKKGILR